MSFPLLAPQTYPRLIDAARILLTRGCHAAGILALTSGLAGGQAYRPGVEATDGQGDLQIAVGFEGSCPQSLEGVRREGANRFRIFPSWRPSPGVGEDAMGRSTRLGFKVVNLRSSSQSVELAIDWQYHQAPRVGAPRFSSLEEFMSYRDFVVVRGPGETDWRTRMVDVAESIGSVRLDVAPGTTEIHWHPPYTYTQGEKFVEALRAHPLVKVEQLGQSGEGRNLWLLRITGESARPRKPVLIYARLHAYESAGSYTMEGMVNWLLSAEPYAAAALHDYAFHVVPMANPDGVFNGLGKNNTPGGLDLQYLLPVTSPEQEALKRAIDRVRPAVLIDLHNWQSKRTDGALFFEPALRDHFIRFMPDQLQFGKYWTFRDPVPLPAQPPEKEHARMYARRMFNPVAVTFELPWFGRQPADVRDTGRTALWALLRALDEPPNAAR